MITTHDNNVIDHIQHNNNMNDTNLNNNNACH